MRTAAEIAGLLAETLRLLRARWWLLGFWFSLGWALHQLGLFAAAQLGVGHALAANLCFVVAVVVKLSSLVLMVHCLKPQLRYRHLLGPETDDSSDFPIPAQVFGTERAVDVAALAVGPFLAVYAVWGFVDDEVRALFVSNYTVLGIGDAQNWSISLDARRLPFYAGFAVAGWLLRQAIALIQRRRRRVAVLSLLAVLAEGIWTFATFVVVIIVLRNYVRGWLAGRVVTVELLAGWRSFLAALPDWKLIFGARLADLVEALVGVLPGAAATVVLLPLMWLALTATVYGWREFRARDVAAGTRAADRLERLSSRPVGLLGGAALLATSDLRTKYLPVVQALRLVLRAGPRFVGAYLLLATCLSSLDRLAQIGLTVLIGPQPLAVSVLIDPLQQFLVGLVIMSASVALYAAGFDRALLDARARGAEPADGDAVDQPANSITSAPSRSEIRSDS